MRIVPVLLFCGTIAVGFFTAYLRYGKSDLQEIYTDTRGDTWRVPSSGWVSDITNWVIEAVPRVNTEFTIISPDFDLDNSHYINTTIMYILIVGAVGVLFFLCVVIFFMFRYLCGCCGGRKLPRKGYSQSIVSAVRMTLVILSFFLEGILLYGYFANTDLHDSMSKLSEVFKKFGDDLKTEMDILIDTLPDETGNPTYDNHTEAFKADIAFSTRWAQGQTSIMDNLIHSFEGYRMGVVLVNLIVATLGCAIGVAAGSVSKGGPAIVMCLLLAVSGAVTFFSAGTHFAGSKMIYEYCDEISYYLESGNADIIPMRLQFFVPCVASPVFPFIQDYYVINLIMSIEKFMNKMTEYNYISEEISNSPPQWFNISNVFYQNELNLIEAEGEEEIAKKQEVQNLYNEAVNQFHIFSILDRNGQCAYSKDVMRNENFLMCTYMKDNLDMMTMTQVVGAVLIVIITLIGIPAIRKFQWAGNARLGGVLNGKKKFAGKGARAKRAVA